MTDSEKLEIAISALDRILNNVALDWYVQQFTKPSDYSNGNTGVAALIHNRETHARALSAFEYARRIREVLK